MGEAGARLAGAVSAVWFWRAVGQVWDTAVGGGVRKRPMAARVQSFFLDRFAVRVWGMGM